MALPDPAFSLSIPSLHDDTTLTGRVYHPAALYESYGQDGVEWAPRGAILAHPYAPLGGNQDNPVVLMAAEELLLQGFVVGTFNFRGAGTSRGHTSWTAKPEILDYMSFAGFFMHYLHLIGSSSASFQTRRHVSDATLSPIPSNTILPTEKMVISKHTTVLILGGYSYGSMIATSLPPIKSIVARFADGQTGTTEAEITLRAARLAHQWGNEQRQKAMASWARTRRPNGPGSHRSSPHMLFVMGGEESEPGSRRTSRDTRRSLDSIRKSFDFSRERRNYKRGDSSGSEGRGSQEDEAPRMMTPSPTTAFLLISPLLPPISTLATFFTDPARSFNQEPAAVQSRLTTHATLALYGTRDTFTSLKKLHKWSLELSNTTGSRFSSAEVPGAGHFWSEEDVEERFRESVGQFAERLSSHCPN
ncbi:MAG: hypothetical protein M1838_003926 [Thelocarpon superellum]|nr:MAG: hypothetical protein M1838_003926 [Thelocarpon superellum]